MPYHPDFPELCAEVVVNDEALKEYDDEEDSQEHPTEVISKYVQVDSDAHFGVRYTIPADLTGECGIRSQLLLDGKTITSYFHSRQGIERGGVTNCLDKFYTTIDGSNYEQRFRFAQLQIGQSNLCDITECTCLIMP